MLIFDLRISWNRFVGKIERKSEPIFVFRFFQGIRGNFGIFFMNLVSKIQFVQVMHLLYSKYRVCTLVVRNNYRTSKVIRGNKTALLVPE